MGITSFLFLTRTLPYPYSVWYFDLVVKKTTQVKDLPPPLSPNKRTLTTNKQTTGHFTFHYYRDLALPGGKEPGTFEARTLLITL